MVDTRSLSAVVVLLIGFQSSFIAQAGETPTFESSILPILQAHCIACHSGQTPQAQLDLRTKSAIITGGKSGRAIQVGSSEKSLLIEKVISGSMPPTGEKLRPAEIALIRLWIDKGAPSDGEEAQTAAKKSHGEITENEVMPIFQMRFTVCHGKRKQEGGLDLRTQASRLKGGKSGPALVPGKLEDSLLLKKVLSGEMPPPKMLYELAVRPPSSSEVEVLRRWIEAGAPPAKRPVVAEAAEPLVSDEDRKFWSFQPPKRFAVPTVRQQALVRTPIDAFLLQKLEAKDLSFSAAADRLTLLRRASLDLTGLPPSQEEIEGYINDVRPDAYEKLVDRLLDSPHYGERWGQFWLNAAGYSDSEGIKAKDRIRPDAWRYRDYVIRSLNSDKPYDQFLLERIAGDELVDYKHAKEVSQADLQRDVLRHQRELCLTPVCAGQQP
jgi:hypothetical protein